MFRKEKGVRNSDLQVLEPLYILYSILLIKSRQSLVFCVRNCNDITHAYILRSRTKAPSVLYS